MKLKPRTERLAEEGSLSLHPPDAQITITVEMGGFRRPHSDSWATSGSGLTTRRNNDRNSRYVHTSRTARVGEDELEIALTLETSGVEEAGVEQSLCGHSLRDRLGDDGLSCPGEPVQQMNKGPVEIVCQELNFIQNVPLRQPFRSPCRYSACGTQRKLLRTAASPAGNNRSSGPPLRRLK
jgi:hypothetical protein